MIKVEKEALYNLYVINGMPMQQVAEELHISTGSVYNYLHKYGIATRSAGAVLGRKLSPEQCERISKLHKGKVVSKETRDKMSESHKISGKGHKKKRADGYIAIYYPNHPKSNASGYIMEHILVMETLIGRHLKEDEVVHHINGIKNDNRQENLKLMTFKEHAGYHMKERWQKRKVVKNNESSGNYREINNRSRSQICTDQ